MVATRELEQYAVVPGDEPGVVLFDCLWGVFLGVYGRRGECRVELA